MEPAAVVYFTNNTIIVAAMARTATGLSLETEPQPLGRHAKVANLAEALARSLARSTMPIDEPAEDAWRRRFIPFQDAARVKNFRTFMRQARRVDLDRMGDTVRLTPTRNLGEKNGFEAIEDAAVIVPAAALDDVARAVLRLLDLR